MCLRQITLITVIMKSQKLINQDLNLYLLISVIRTYLKFWWRLGESNSWPPACKAGALPTKLSPQLTSSIMYLLSITSTSQSHGGSDKTWTCDPRLSSVCSNQLSYRPSDTSMKNNLLWILTNRQSFVKEVIQPQVPLRLPCYDFTPVIGHTVVTALFAVRLATSGATNSHGVTGGVYKARERIHRGILIRDY